MFNNRSHELKLFPLALPVNMEMIRWAPLTFSNKQDKTADQISGSPVGTRGGIPRSELNVEVGKSYTSGTFRYQYRGGCDPQTPAPEWGEKTMSLILDLRSLPVGPLPRSSYGWVSLANSKLQQKLLRAFTIEFIIDTDVLPKWTPAHTCP